MLKEKLKMMIGVLENGNIQLGQFQFIEVLNSIQPELIFRSVYVIFAGIDRPGIILR